MNKLLLVLLMLFGPGLADGTAYVRTTSATGTPVAWPEGTVTLHIQVGCPVGACFSQATQAAAEEWNAAGARFAFQVDTSPGPPVACTERTDDINGRVTVFWASDQRCSPPISADFLALTHLWTTGDGRVADADIEFNDLGFNAFRWGVYAGPAQLTTYDFQRVVLHELGHVAGLDHPDEHGQHVPAIMNSESGSLAHLQPDDVAGIRAIYGRPAATTIGALENPGPEATKTGVGLISGWVCDADTVEIEMGHARIPAAYKMSREDTRSVCGDADNGFALLVNWNLLGAGTHRIRLLANEQELVSRTVEVQTFGAEFMRGQDAEWIIADWPTPGTDTIIGWTEALQNIEIVEIIP